MTNEELIDAMLDDWHEPMIAATELFCAAVAAAVIGGLVQILAGPAIQFIIQL